MLDYIASAALVVGVVLVIKKRRVGWLFQLAGSALFGLYAMTEISSPPMVLTEAIFVFLAVVGWEKWK